MEFTLCPLPYIDAADARPALQTLVDTVTALRLGVTGVARIANDVSLVVHTSVVTVTPTTTNTNGRALSTTFLAPFWMGQGAQASTHFGYENVQVCNTHSMSYAQSSIRYYYFKIT
jgi:hypothetical protein